MGSNPTNPSVAGQKGGRWSLGKGSVGGVVGREGRVGRGMVPTLTPSVRAGYPTTPKTQRLPEP